MNVDDAFHGISTIIIAKYGEVQSQGSGFFYDERGNNDPQKEGWVEIKNTWLVTNRHVILDKLNDGKEIIPDMLTFGLRRIEGDKVVWEKINLDKTELIARAKVHQNNDIDVAAIRIHDLLVAKVSDTSKKYLNWYAVNSNRLPGQNKIKVEVADDAVVIGYPRGFYDKHNVFPIVKSGIIASRWGANFDGQPYFLIDAKLYPGSSGSIVVSKPINIVVEGGQLFFNSTEKQFAFLGIFSGEPYTRVDPIEFDDLTIIRKPGYNIGIVWYGHLVDEIIRDGKSIGA